MRDKLFRFAVIAFSIFSYISSVTSTICYSCADEIACQRQSQLNVTKACTDQCATIFSEFVPIKKSCVSDLTTAENQLCSDVTNPLCYQCSTDYCNNLGRIDHTCITCTTDNGNINCLRDPTSITKTRCPAPTIDEAYCYVNSVRSQTIRGCLSSSREIEQCLSDSSNCSVCIVDGTLEVPCNSYAYPTNRRKCLTCSGTNCRDSNSATSVYCLDPNDNCVSINNYRNFKQTCASEINDVDNAFCDSNSASCSLCNSTDCNTQFPRAPDDIDCYSCEGLSCLRSSLYNTTTFCDNTDKCVSLFDGFTPIKKTCYANLATDEKLKCDDLTDTSCYACTGSRCNNLGRENHLCYSCSSQNDENCLQDPTRALTTRCAAPISEEVYCFVNSSSTSTTRGCVSSTRELEYCSENNSTCSVCPVDSTKPCNSYPYPTNRRKCIRCSGTNCDTTTSSSLYCKHPDDDCVSINNFGNHKQACATERSATDIKFCSDHKLSCTTCNSNDCNNALPKSPDDYIECFSCEGISCQRSTLYNQTKHCQKSDSCVSLFENFLPVKKSCYIDLLSNEKSLCDDSSNPACYKCSGNKCNNMGRTDHRCIQCTTANNTNCLQNPQSVQAIRCPAPISDDAYCFITSVGNTVTRGCLLTPKAIATCDNNQQQCSYCPVNSTTSCNTYVFPTGRRQCHNLRGSNANIISTTPLKYCPYADDSCLIIKSNGTLSQVCSRDKNVTEIGICDKHRECCSTCSSSNNCNVKIPDARCNALIEKLSLGVVLIALISFLMNLD